MPLHEKKQRAQPEGIAGSLLSRRKESFSPIQIITCSSTKSNAGAVLPILAHPFPALSAALK
jgi:hypothetical protein